MLHKQSSRWKVIAILVALVAASSGALLDVHARNLDRTSLQGQVLAIAAKLRVPSEHDTMTAANSPEPLAQHMRYQIQQDLLQGQNPKQILKEMRQQYGTDVLAAPANQGYGTLVWWLPALALVILLLSVSIYLLNERRRAPSISESSTDPESNIEQDREIRSRVEDFL